MAMLPDWAVSLLIQVPLVGAFILFTLQLNKQNLEYHAKRDAEWRAFLEQQQSAFTDSLGRLGHEMRRGAKERTAQQAATHALLVSHDQRAAAGIAEIMTETRARGRRKSK